jgi:hypothetical protein
MTLLFLLLLDGTAPLVPASQSAAHMWCGSSSRWLLLRPLSHNLYFCAQHQTISSNRAIAATHGKKQMHNRRQEELLWSTTKGQRNNNCAPPWSATFFSFGAGGRVVGENVALEKIQNHDSNFFRSMQHHKTPYVWSDLPLSPFVSALGSNGMKFHVGE